MNFALIFFSAFSVYLNGVHEVDFPPSQYRFCTATVFMLYSSFLSSTYLLIAMTFERFYSIIRPHKAASFNTVKRAKMIIVCTYAFGFSYSIPLLFVASNIGRTCVPIENASHNTIGQMYHWLTEILIFIFPFISLLTMNSVIIQTLRKRSKLKILEPTGQDENGGKNMKTKHTEKQVITMLLLVTFVFLVLNIPTRGVVYYLNFYNGNTPYYYAGLHLFYEVGSKSYFTNHGINFFLYVISGQKFRTDLKNLFILKKTHTNKSLWRNTTTLTSTINNSMK